MKAMQSFFLPSAAVILLAFYGCGDDATGPDARTGALEGIVAGAATGEPLAGIAVLLLDDAMGVAAVTATGVGGRYEFTTLPAGSYLVCQGTPTFPH